MGEHSYKTQKNYRVVLPRKRVITYTQYTMPQSNITFKI